MKASDCIEVLKKLIQEEGDLDLFDMQYYEQDKSSVFSMDFCFYVEYPEGRDRVYDEFSNIIEREKVIAISRGF